MGYSRSIIGRGSATRKRFAAAGTQPQKPGKTGLTSKATHPMSMQGFSLTSTSQTAGSTRSTGHVPNWQIRKEGLQTTYHVAYTLEIPVARHNAAQERIVHYYRDIYDGLSCLFDADPRFDGVMAKNPLHPPAGCSAEWIRRAPYSLTELREWLPAKIPKPILTTGVGRNEDLFHHCVKLAHQPHWARIIDAQGHNGEWLEYVRRLNYAEYAEDPLPDSECKSIAKSCAKYSLRQFSEERFSRRQTARITRRWHPGQKSYSYAERANTASLMVNLGYTKPEIASIFGVTVRTIERDLAKTKANNDEQKFCDIP